MALLKALPSVPGRAFEQISVDGVVLCFALGVAVFTGLVFGLAPALQVGARDLHDDLKSGGKGAGAAASSSKWLRNSLVVGEIALSLCLLIAAGLLLRTFERLRAIEIGVRPDKVLTAKVALPDTQYKDDAQFRGYREMAERLEQAPGVDAAAVSSEIPLDGGTNTYAKKPGAPAEELGSLMEWNEITPGYFKTFGIPFRAGRNFTDADYELVAKVTEASKKSPSKYDGPMMVGIINQKMASEFWPDEDAVGHVFELDTLPVQVIGVVADTKIFNSPRQKTIDEAYFPIGWGSRTEMAITVHGAGAAASLPETMRRTIAGVDSKVPVFNVREMEPGDRGGEFGRAHRSAAAWNFCGARAAACCGGNLRRDVVSRGAAHTGTRDSHGAWRAAARRAAIGARARRDADRRGACDRACGSVRDYEIAEQAVIWSECDRSVDVFWSRAFAGSRCAGCLLDSGAARDAR